MEEKLYFQFKEIKKKTILRVEVLYSFEEKFCWSFQKHFFLKYTELSIERILRMDLKLIIIHNSLEKEKEATKTESCCLPNCP